MTGRASVEEQFAAIDADQDGFITKTELRKSLEENAKVTDRHVKTIMRIADESGDGRISLAEYKNFLGW